MKVDPPVSLSVVIPNYNHAAYLPECLDSVLSQSVQPRAIYVADDGSTDNSLEILHAYAKQHPHLRIRPSERNRGVWPTLNGLLPDLAESHALCLAADNYLRPGCIESAYELLSEHPQAGVCAWEIMDVYPDGRQKCFAYAFAEAPAFFAPERVPQILRRRGLVGVCFVRVDGLRRIGGFPERLQWRADYFVCWVLAARYGFCYFPRVGSVFRKLPGSYSMRPENPARERDILEGFLEYLTRPDFADVREAARDGQMLALFEDGLLWTLCRNPSHRQFLTPSFASRLLFRSWRHRFRHPVPRFIKQWFRKHLQPARTA